MTTMAFRLRADPLAEKHLLKINELDLVSTAFERVCNDLGSVPTEFVARVEIYLDIDDRRPSAVAEALVS